MPRLRDLSIKAKLSAGFGLSLALIFAIGAISLVQFRSINTLSGRVTESWLPQIVALGEIKRAMGEHYSLAKRRINTSDVRQIASDSAGMRAAQAEVDVSTYRFRMLANKVRFARATNRKFLFDFMAADGVVVKPVSTAKFPANREKNRDDFDFGAVFRLDPQVTAMISEPWSQIPCSLEQGICQQEQGLFGGDQGKFGRSRLGTSLNHQFIDLLDRLRGSD